MWLARALRAADSTVPSVARGRALVAAGELAHFQSDYAAATGCIREQRGDLPGIRR